MADVFTLNTYIIKSSHKDYTINKNHKLKLLKKIGEGSYGLVFLVENNHVVKIFKNSNKNNTVLNESNYLLPLNNENRELLFYYKYRNSKKDKNYIISLYCIGIIKDIIVDNNVKLDLNSYFIILPYCIPFYENFNIFNISLINEKNGLNFTLNLMKRLIEISLYLKKEYKIINLDFNLNNFMFEKKTKNLENLIMIDFSISKKNTTKKFIIDNDYYIWPKDRDNITLSKLQSYSICINGLELLYGKMEILKNYEFNKLKKIIINLKNKNENIYNLFYTGIILKIELNKLLNLINIIKI